MNILVVNWQDRTHPDAGGAEVHFQEIFARIANRGHQVTLCCCAYPGARKRETIQGIEVIRRGSRALFNFRFPVVYLTQLRDRKFDVVVEDLNKVPFFTPLFVRRPLAGIAHHLFGRSIFRETRSPAAAYVYWMERAATAFYRRRIPFMVVSPSTRDEFISRGFRPDRLAVVHNCVDHARYVPGPEKSATPLVGYFGRLKRYKSVDTLLHALPAVLTRVPDLKIVIAGEGDDRPRLESMAQARGIASAIQFTGYLSEKAKVNLLQRMWFKVATSSKEGWGLTIIEANACGTPAIASDVPGLRDAVKDNETGLLYPYGDADALTARMLLLLQDGELRDRLSANAMRWAKEFDWENAAGKTLDFLTRVAAGEFHSPRH
ncbi:MAG: glycosyltransferase family 4 protein [Bacteroidota bacterium]